MLFAIVIMNSLQLPDRKHNFLRTKLLIQTFAAPTTISLTLFYFSSADATVDVTQDSSLYREHELRNNETAILLTDSRSAR